jgi:hypothetical protein
MMITIIVINKFNFMRSIRSFEMLKDVICRKKIDFIYYKINKITIQNEFIYAKFR